MYITPLISYVIAAQQNGVNFKRYFAKAIVASNARYSAAVAQNQNVRSPDLPFPCPSNSTNSRGTIPLSKPYA